MNDLMTMDKRFTGEQFMLDIVNTKGGNLPKKIEDVILVFEFTDLRAKAWKIMSDKMSKLEEHSEAHNSALRSGQKWGIAALYAQKRMGEITKGIKGVGSGGTSKKSGTIFITKSEQLVNAGLDKDSQMALNKANNAERLVDNPETLDRVIKSSVDRGEIPTKTAVLKTIKMEKAQERSKIKTDKKIEKEVHERPKGVKEYLTANTNYKNALEFAIEYAKQGLFSEESINMIKNRHNQITELMNELEELV